MQSDPGSILSACLVKPIGCTNLSECRGTISSVGKKRPSFDIDINRFDTLYSKLKPPKSHYLMLDGIVNIPIYLIWASWVRNGTTFLSR